jgi:hypothetical protein
MRQRAQIATGPVLHAPATDYGVFACVVCGTGPCASLGFIICEMCRKADARHRPEPADLPEGWDAMSVPGLCNQLARRRGTPPGTVGAVMCAVRARGVAALKETANNESLWRRDAAARTEINNRIVSLIMP